LVIGWSNYDKLNDSQKEALRVEVSQVFGIDKNFDGQKFNEGLLAYPTVKTDEEIERNAGLIERVLKSMDGNIAVQDSRYLAASALI